MKIAKNSEELELALLPDHQGGDVAEGRERAAGIGGDHDIDAGERREAGRTGADRQDHRTHNQRGRQIVENWRKDEGKTPVIQNSCR